MDNDREPDAETRPNRRREIFRAVRASTLTGQRGELDTGGQVLAPRARSAALEKLPAAARPVQRRVALEEEFGGAAEGLDARRYAEPND
jgi:hypothetical protein